MKLFHKYSHSYKNLKYITLGKHYNDLTIEQFYLELKECRTSKEFEEILARMRQEYQDRLQIMPIGGRENNRGQIEIGQDPGKGIIERLTNGIDGVLDYEYKRHGSSSSPLSPKDAAFKWLGIPFKGLYELTREMRREIATNVQLILENDEKDLFNVSIIDNGIGISNEDMHNTILSLGESNKLKKHHLIGAFGQGGSSTFAYCKYSLICSRVNTEFNKKVSFTVVYYEDLPAKEYKHGRYVYLTLDNKLPEAEIAEGFSTFIKHFSYDLYSYRSKIGPNSLYGLLQRALFDPIIPIWFEDRVHKSNRVIKGARNALNGVIDDPDERGPSLKYYIPKYNLQLRDFGTIGVEYWVLEKSNPKYKPITGYVDPDNPILLTLNGQSHAELSVTLIRNTADLPYISDRLILHIDCNNLNPEAKRKLFSSNREDIRKTEIAILIKEEIIKILKADDNLQLINNEIKQNLLKSEDVKSQESIRKEIGKVLSFQGYSSVISENTVNKQKGEGSIYSDNFDTKPTYAGPPKEIKLNDPPTYIKIVDSDPIHFHPGQTKHVKIETDAPNWYVQKGDISIDKFNVILKDKELVYSGASPLHDGRMRVILRCDDNASVGKKGEVRIEISRIGDSALTAIATFEVIPIPKKDIARNTIQIPNISFIETYPEHDAWNTLGWSEEISKEAYDSVLDKDSLIVYYSKVFPQFENLRKKLERKGDTFEKALLKYKVMIGAHSLLLEHRKKNKENVGNFDEWEKDERYRFAILSCMMAEQFVSNEQLEAEAKI